MTAHLRAYLSVRLAGLTMAVMSTLWFTITSKLTRQPVGPQSVARLACLRSGVGQAVGTQCDLGPQSCDSSILFVSTNSCKEYCIGLDACGDGGVVFIKLGISRWLVTVRIKALCPLALSV